MRRNLNVGQRIVSRSCFCVGGPLCCRNQAASMSDRTIATWDRWVEDMIKTKETEDKRPRYTADDESVGSADFRMPGPKKGGIAEDPWWPVMPLD